MVRTGTQDEPQGKLLELFKSVSFADTVRQIGKGRFGDASTEVVLLWEFLGLKLYPRWSKEYRNFIEKGTVVGGSARSLMTTFLLMCSWVTQLVQCTHCENSVARLS